MNEERKIEIEEVDGVDRRRARASRRRRETFERKRDYLEGFLAEQAASRAAGEPGGDLYEAVIDALKSIYDPEIPVNIYDLGLIYDVDDQRGRRRVVTMTLTTPHCPVAESMPGEVELRVAVGARASATPRSSWSGTRRGTRRR